MIGGRLTAIDPDAKASPVHGSIGWLIEMA